MRSAQENRADVFWRQSGKSTRDRLDNPLLFPTFSATVSAMFSSIAR